MFIPSGWIGVCLYVTSQGGRTGGEVVSLLVHPARRVFVGLVMAEASGREALLKQAEYYNNDRYPQLKQGAKGSPLKPG